MNRIYVAVALVCLLTMLSAPSYATNPCEAGAAPYVPSYTPDGVLQPECEDRSAPIIALVETFRDGELLDNDSKVIVLAEDKLKDALDDRLRDGVGTGFDVDVLKYGMIGVDTGLGFVLPEDQTDAQKKTSAARNAAWVRHNSVVKTRANYGKNIPIGNSGAFFTAGIGAGAQIKLTVDTPHTKNGSTPKMILGALKEQVKGGGIVDRLPFRARDWDNCTPGERVVIEAPRHVRLHYGAGYGVSEDLGDYLRAGASAQLTRSRTVSGNLVQTVECLEPGVVTMSLKRAKNKVNDISFSVFAGINVLENEVVDAIDLPDGVGIIDAIAESAIGSVADTVGDALSARYSLRSWDSNPEEVYARGTFDLRKSGARVAYEEAMRGDFHPARELGPCTPSVGVNFDTTTTDFEIEGLNRSLKVSFHDIHSNFNKRDGTRIFQDASGIRTDNISGFNIDRDRELGSAGNLAFEVVIRDGADGQRSAWATANAERRENFTTDGEFQDLLLAAFALTRDDPSANGDLKNVFATEPDGKLGHTPTIASIIVGIGVSIGTANPLPLLISVVGVPFNDDWGETKGTLRLKLNEKGMIAITQASKDEVYDALTVLTPKKAWANDSRRAAYEYAAEHCEKNRSYNNSQDTLSDKFKCSGAVDTSTFWDLDQFMEVKEKADAVLALKSIPDPIERARKGRDIMESFREPHLLFLGRAYDPTGLVAMGLLAGKDGREISISLEADGGDMAYSWSQR